MPTPYSIDLRSRVIMVWVAKEGSQRQLAERFKVSLSFIRDLLRRYRETGQIEPKQCGGYEKPIIEEEYLNMIKSWLDEKNDLLLSEVCDRFRERTRINVSIPTRHRALKKLGLRHKKSLNASEQDTPRVQELRHDYRRWLDTIDIRNLVFVDESGINLGMSRLFARSQDGERAIGRVPGNKGKNISLIGALNMDGILAAMTVPGSTNTVAENR